MITFINVQRDVRVSLKKLRRRAQWVLRALAKNKKHTHLSNAQLNVRLVGDAEMKKWHRRYFGKTSTTDVISFPLRGKNEKALHANLLGDIVICVPTAKRASAARGHATEKELTLYLIHGLLHLLGYDDQTKAQKKEMDEEQFSLLDKAMQLRGKSKGTAS